jgi:hypothetical protein
MDKSVYKINFTGSLYVEVPKNKYVLLEKMEATEKGKDILLNIELEKNIILNFQEIEFQYLKK